MKAAASKPLPPPDVSIYRGATIWMLRRYFNMSVELGRLPSIMGREVFRSTVHGHPASFENVVIYVLDIERCVQRLRRRDQELITRVVLQEYTQEEAARLLGWPVITVERRLPEVLDDLSQTFLRLGLLKSLDVAREEPAPRNKGRERIREAVVDEICATAAQLRTRSCPSWGAETEDFSAVPVEIFLSSPLDVTNPANSLVP